MKVIFVDDSKIVLKTFARLVEDLVPKYNLLCSYYNDPKELYALIDNETVEYDVLFTDINMPDISGYSLASKAKSKKKYRFSPIVAITIEYSESSKKEGTESGIDAWLIKSIAKDSLQISLEKIFKKLSQR